MIIHASGTPSTQILVWHDTYRVQASISFQPVGVGRCLCVAGIHKRPALGVNHPKLSWVDVHLRSNPTLLRPANFHHLYQSLSASQQQGIS